LFTGGDHASSALPGRKAGARPGGRLRNNDQDSRRKTASHAGPAAL